MIFKEDSTPKDHTLVTENKNFTWLTWSDDFRKEHKTFQKQLALIKSIDIIKLNQYKSESYSLALERLDKGFLKDFRYYAESLMHFDPDVRIIFFSNLIDKKINGKIFHFLFAAFRSIITDTLKNKMGALYIPLIAGKNISELPLHCDLFLPKILFNVFERVAKDNSGHSTFLKLNHLFDNILPEIKFMPLKVKHKIKQIFNSVTKKDKYWDVMNLLYNEKHLWAEETAYRLNNDKFRIKFSKGEGYMINDKIWMHGRDHTNGGVSIKRLHRLAFANITNPLVLNEED